MQDKISALTAEYEFVVDFGDVIIAVDKVGGGTLPREYTGDWWVYTFDLSGNQLESAIAVNTAMPHTHAWVAEFVLEDFRWSE